MEAENQKRQAADPGLQGSEQKRARIDGNGQQPDVAAVHGLGSSCTISNGACLSCLTARFRGAPEGATNPQTDSDAVFSCPTPKGPNCVGLLLCRLRLCRLHAADGRSEDI